MMLTIGVPVFNGEKYLAEKIPSLLTQLEDSEIIISDNASTDQTEKICREFAYINPKIRYVRLDKNMGAVKNFRNILDCASGEFIMFTAVDDDLLPEFAVENIDVMRDNPNIVCSSGQVRYRIEKKYAPLKNIEAKGNFENKIRKYLKARGHHHMFYGVFRTDVMKKIFVSEFQSGFDWATLLNGLKEGDYHVTEKTLMIRDLGGYSSNGFFNYKKSLGLSFLQALFHYHPFTKWCFRNLGYGVCIRNLDLFLILNLEGVFYFGVDVIRSLKRGLQTFSSVEI